MFITSLFNMDAFGLHYFVICHGVISTLYFSLEFVESLMSYLTNYRQNAYFWTF
jgi:hypothetical protein